MSFSKVIFAMILVAFALLLGACSPTEADPTPAYRIVSERSLTAGEDIPAPSSEVVLTVTGKIGTSNVDETIQMDIATIEALGQVDYTVNDPFETVETTFRGVLMSDLLDLWQVAEDATTLHIVALNDYAIDVPIEDLRRYPVILALQANGDYMPVSTRGPAMLVYPYGEYEFDTAVYNDYWIWQIKSVDVR